MIDLAKIFRRNVAAIDPATVLPRSERVDWSARVEMGLEVLLGVILFVTPLLFVPILSDWFDLPKRAFLIFTLLLALALWFSHSVLTKKLLVTSSSFFFPILAISAVSVTSALLTTNRYLAVSGDPVVYTGCLLLTFVITQVISKEKATNTLLTALLASASVLAVLFLGQTAIGLVPALQPLAANPYLSPSFSPAGSPLAVTIFFALCLPAALGWYKQNHKLLSLVLAVVVALGVASGLFTLYRQRPILLPQSVGWKVATATLGDNFQSAFLGVGPSNFVDAFTANKPVAFNTNLYWNLRFTTSSNLYFYLLTTTGIAGLAAILLLAAKIIKVAQKRLRTGVTRPLEKGLIGSLLVGLVSFALLPAPLIVLTTFFGLLGILLGTYRVSENSAYVSSPVDLSTNNAWFRPGGMVITLAVAAFVGYQALNFLWADYYFAQSVTAAANNRGTDTYNLQIKALEKNQWQDGYRISYAQTNLALADALAGSPNLSDEQKQTVVALVQQAIREARLAVGLTPKRAANWENLAFIYRGLINFAQGADQWTVASLNQAINLDPTNPRLRLDLGGVFYSRQDYQTAAQHFATAVTLKDDYANAHYNLAQALKQLKLNDQASQQLQLAASLVCASDQNSADCQRVNDEIKGLAPAPAASPAAEVNLATPSGQTNLPKARTQPPAQVASPSGELTP